ncbi:hypothetical protein ACWDAZ_31285 [Streptomyces sp. NPDC001215]
MRDVAPTSELRKWYGHEPAGRALRRAVPRRLTVPRSPAPGPPGHSNAPRRPRTSSASP